MSTLGGVSLEVVVQQLLHSTLSKQQLNPSFTGKENKQDPLGKDKPIWMGICAFTKVQQQSLTSCLAIPTNK